MGILEWATSPLGQRVPIHIAWFLIWVALIAGLVFLIVHAIYVPEDQTCFYLYEADSADEVREAAHRAQIGAGRVVAAITQVKGAKP